MADFEAVLRQMSNENTAKTFEFNSSEAQKERDWSKMMSDTSHQRQVEDLKRAGLNPVLSANSGASSYSGASASGQADSSSVGALASIYQTKMNNDNAVKIAKMQNENNLKLAKINAAASNYASNMSSSASRYSADQNYYASTYGTNNSKYGLVSQFINGASGSKSSNTGKSVGSRIRSSVGNLLAKHGSDSRVKAFGRKLMK